MKSRARLSALVVNYNSGAFCVRCVTSVFREWEREGRERADLDVIVVDNASPENQAAHLDELEALGATVVRHDENGGYAKGMNLALTYAGGGPDDVIAVLNPDLCFLPGSLGLLMDHVHENERCGAVDPRATIDPLGVLNLPRNILPTLGDQFEMGIAGLSPRICRAYSKRRLALNLPWWTAREPMRADMLSGCCLFLRRSVVDAIGGLLDERFPLYYEDTDLFRRITDKGYELVHHGGALVLHHWSRSSGVGGSFAGEPQRRYLISRRAYFEKWYGKSGVALIGALDKLYSWWPAKKRFRAMHPVVELGPHTEPFTIPLPRRVDRLLIELAVAPTWLVAVGIFGERSDHWTCPAETWDWFFQAEYFLRAIDLDTGELLGAFHVTKTIPGRNTPLTEPELEAYAERLGITAEVVA
ncbi:MAG: glycosyltransferase family 2 protein [Planctomycetota bacterium]